jgi:hypothetical protein
MRPGTGITINEAEEPATKLDCGEFTFDPRVKQQEIDCNHLKVYRCGGKLYAKIDDCEEKDADQKKNFIKEESELIELIEKLFSSHKVVF